MDYRKSKLDERYNNDAVFHALVKTLHNMIAQHGITPSEMREAIFLAHYRYEMENPHVSHIMVNERMLEYLQVDKSRYREG